MLKRFWRWLWPVDTYDPIRTTPHNWAPWEVTGVNEQERVCRTCHIIERTSLHGHTMFEMQPECTKDEA